MPPMDTSWVGPGSWGEPFLEPASCSALGLRGSGGWRQIRMGWWYGGQWMDMDWDGFVVEGEFGAWIEEGRGWGCGAALAGVSLTRDGFVPWDKHGNIM